MKQYSFLIENINESFSLDKFKKFTNINDRVKYCNNILNLISYGAGKRVYMLQDKVLKIAYNKNGYDQNKCEIEISKYNFPFLCKTYNCDKQKYSWLISEYCYKTLKRDESNLNEINSIIKKITGYDHLVIWFLGHILICGGGLDNFKKYKSTLGKAFDKIIEFKGDKDLFHGKNRSELYRMCDKLKIDKDKQDFMIDHYLDAMWYFGRRVRKNDGLTNYKYIFKLIDSGKYKSINFLTDILKVKNIEKVIDFSDCLNPFNTGIVNRNNKDYLVILDCGFNRWGRRK